METGTEYITDSQHDEKETKRDFLRYISDAMYSENDIKLTDTLMMIHNELKRFNDHVERKDEENKISKGDDWSMPDTKPELIECRACGHQISVKAKSCPNCGDRYSLKEKYDIWKKNRYNRIEQNKSEKIILKPDQNKTDLEKGLEFIFENSKL